MYAEKKTFYARVTRAKMWIFLFFHYVERLFPNSIPSSAKKELEKYLFRLHLKLSLFHNFQIKNHEN